MSQDSDIEVAVDAADHERAVVDATRALVIQNARFSHRFDIAKKWRSPRFQKLLADFGAIVCGLGAVLAVFSIGIEWTDSGQVPWLRVGMLVLLIALFILFQNLDRVLSMGYSRVNASLRKKARLMLEATGERVPAAVSYRVEDGVIEGVWRDGGEQVASWTHALTDSTYVLVGDACVAAFDAPEKLFPAFFCFLDDASREAVLDLLREHGAEIEQIEPALLEEADDQRPWPSPA
jgi:hypothetical protein